MLREVKYTDGSVGYVHVWDDRDASHEWDGTAPRRINNLPPYNGGAPGRGGGWASVMKFPEVRPASGHADSVAQSCRTALEASAFLERINGIEWPPRPSSGFYNTPVAQGFFRDPTPLDSMAHTWPRVTLSNGHTVWPTSWGHACPPGAVDYWGRGKPDVMPDDRGGDNAIELPAERGPSPITSAYRALTTEREVLEAIACNVVAGWPGWASVKPKSTPAADL